MEVVKEKKGVRREGRRRRQKEGGGMLMNFWELDGVCSSLQGGCGAATTVTEKNCERDGVEDQSGTVTTAVAAARAPLLRGRGARRRSHHRRQTNSPFLRRTREDEIDAPMIELCGGDCVL